MLRSLPVVGFQPFGIVEEELHHAVFDFQTVVARPEARHLAAAVGPVERQKRQAFTEQMQNLTMDDIRRLMESSVDLGGVSDPQAEIERRIERNGMAYLMKDGAVYAVVLSSDDYERLADKKA